MQPRLLALDFDGVICNTVAECFRSAWSVYCQIWNGHSPEPSVPPPGPAELDDRFNRLRPVIEIGWEFVVLLRLLVEGVREEEIFLGFHDKLRYQMLEKHGLKEADLSSRLDRVRDRWIKSDRMDWLRSQEFYPGVRDRLNQVLHSGILLFVITTKEGRFAVELLKQNGVFLPPDQVLGKEQNKPKGEVLRQVSKQCNIPYANFWFVEDRLKTLQNVENEDDLKEVGLYLAEWGYNTPDDQRKAMDAGISVLSLAQFCGDFASWGPKQ